MVDRILQFLFISCNHRKTTQPFLAAAASNDSGEWETVTSGASHYVVCLDCGKKFMYDWGEMRIVK